MTFAQIKADVYRRCGFQATPANDVITRIAAFVNEVQQDILSEPGMEFLSNDSVTFASVANQQQYGLPLAVAKLKFLRETTNRIQLHPMSLGEYRAAYPDPAAVTGTPRRFVDLGRSAVALQPSDASTLYVVSSSSSDIVTAYLEGYRSGGIPFTDAVVMTGQTAVAFTYNDVIEVTHFNLSSAALGLVTLREDSGVGTVLASIPIALTTSHYRSIALAPTPSAVITYTLDFERDVRDLSVDSDEPVIPTRFHRILAIGARAKEYEKQNQIQRWQVATGEYAKELKKLKFWLYEQSVGTPNMQGSTVSRKTLGDGGTLAQASSSTASPLAATAGGTGFASYTIGDLLYADTAASLAKLSDVASGKVLRSGGVGVAPAYGQVVLTTDVTGTLPFVNGGTGLASGTSGGVLGFTGTTTLASSVLLTANALVLGGGAGATPTPMGSLGTTATVLHGNAAGAPTFAAVALATEVSGQLPVANGGTSLASGTSGGVLAFTGSGTIVSSAALAATALVKGGGAGVAPSTDANLTINTQSQLNSATQFRCILSNSAVQSISDSTSTSLTFDTEDIDVGGMHTGSGSVITIPTGGAGFYHFEAYVSWAGNATGQRQALFRKNSSTNFITDSVIGSTAINVDNVLSMHIQMADGDTMDVRVFQSSGGALNTGTTHRFSCVKLW